MVTLVILIWLTAPWESRPDSWFGLVTLIALNLSPYLGLALIYGLLSRSLAQSIVGLLCTVLVALFGIGMLVDALVLHPSLPNFFLLLAIAPWQWLFVGAGGTINLALWLVARAGARSAS